MALPERSGDIGSTDGSGSGIVDSLPYKVRQLIYLRAINNRVAVEEFNKRKKLDTGERLLMRGKPVQVRA